MDIAWCILFYNYEHYFENTITNERGYNTSIFTDTACSTFIPNNSQEISHIKYFNRGILIITFSEEIPNQVIFSEEQVITWIMINWINVYATSRCAGASYSEHISNQIHFEVTRTYLNNIAGLLKRNKVVCNVKL